MVLAVVVVAGLFFVRSGEKRVTVRVAEVQRSTIDQRVSTNGKVVPTVDFQAHAPTGGEVKALYVSLNDTVKAGQPLLRLSDAQARKDVAAAEAGVASAEAQLDAMKKGGTQDERIAAKGDLESAELQQRQAAGSVAALEKLQAQGAASLNEVTSAKQRLAESTVKVNQLKTRQSDRYSTGDLQTQQAAVQQAQSSLDAARAELAAVDVKAPFGGTVYAIPVSQYDFVQAGDALLDVADLNKLEVLAYFDEPDVGKLANGQPVKIVWDAKPQSVWHGHVLESPTTIITYGTRNVGECLISVDDAHGDLLPNTNVTVTVTTMQHPDVLSIPREALHSDGSSNYVYRIVGDKLVKTPVQVGLINLTLVEITGGLSTGDKVALNATSEEDLKDGLPVKVEN
ncbi:efflux RND transporter periplasmic adaptor subunit [Granulicella sp. 5B5]|uniref:efflux RND transporter periplasmic adaptor subunit n=1 Tax=Granulicella sp. 5B5 TaxID=1617967 RepID=UPI0023DE0B38|nr:efflux RND transporter periplasmic adaptor subunit [Granulicella sp. 5B5]